MTPAERARQIDREEFEAECAAARGRALAYSKKCRELEAKKVSAWVYGGADSTTVAVRGIETRHQKRGTKKASRASSANAKLFSAFGQKRTLVEWANVSGINANTLCQRIRKNGWTLERALVEPSMGNGHQRALFHCNRRVMQRIANSYRIPRIAAAFMAVQ